MQEVMMWVLSEEIRAVFLIWQWHGLANLAARAIPAGVAAASSAPQAVNPMALALITPGTASAGAMILAALHRRLGRALL
jgi:hypothetical protein